jgi:hypothetical protein
VGNCHIAESPSSFHSLRNHQNPLFFLCLRMLLSSRSRALLLRPSLSQGRAYNLISCAPHRILHQRMTWQYPLPSIVASHTSALLANTRSTQLPRLVPADCLPYPCPPQFSNHLPARYLTTGRTPSCSFALLVSIAPYQSQSYSVCYRCCVDIRLL